MSTVEHSLILRLNTSVWVDHYYWEVRNGSPCSGGEIANVLAQLMLALCPPLLPYTVPIAFCCVPSFTSLTLSLPSLVPSLSIIFQKFSNIAILKWHHLLELRTIIQSVVCSVFRAKWNWRLISTPTQKQNPSQNFCLWPPPSQFFPKASQELKFLCPRVIYRS